MPSIHRSCAFSLGAAAVALSCARPGWAALSASATISTAQTSAPFNYTVTLNNTGDTSIGTFWFAWIPSPSYNFLPHSPTNISTPSGWLSPINHIGIPQDGYSIEWYNYLGANIPAQGSQTFSFTSVDSPTEILGDAWFGANKVTTSYIYINGPLTDPGFRLDVQVVPEPGCIALGCAAGALLLARRRI
jgi:hypothetical protein